MNLRNSLLLCLLALGAASLPAADRLWTGAVDDDWGTAGNWSGGVPGAADTAVFDGTFTLPAMIMGASGTVGAIRVSAPSPWVVVEIEVSAAFTVAGLSSRAITVEGMNELHLDNASATVVLGADVWVEDGHFQTTGAAQIGTGAAGQYVQMDVANGELMFGAVTVRQVSGAGGSAATNLLVRGRAPTGTGTCTMASLVVEGDTTDDVGATPESNAARAIFDSVAVFIGGSVTVNDGSGAAGNEGSGGRLEIEDCTVNVGANINVGNGVSAQVDSGAGMDVVASTITFAAAGGLSVNARASFGAVSSTMTGSGAWTLNSVATTVQMICLACTINSAIANGLTLTLGAATGSVGLGLIDCDFSNYTAAGLNIRAGALLLALSECTFTGGQAGGSHITLNGLNAGSNPVADLNQFDESTGTGATAMANAAAATALAFRVGTGGDFGAGAVTISAATAEARDNDGSTPLVNVVWTAGSPVLTVAEHTTQPAGLQANSAATDQPLFFFNATATTGNSRVTALSVNLELEPGQGSSLSAADLQEVKLFVDVNANNQYDSATDSLLDATSTFTGDVAAFTIAGGRTINQGTTERWGLAVSFGASIAGNGGWLGLLVLPGTGLVADDGGIPIPLPVVMAGMPLYTQGGLAIAGAPDRLEIQRQPARAFAGTAFGDQPVVVLVDAQGVPCTTDSTHNITATIQTDPPGGTTIGGTAMLAATNGVATFTNLSLSKAGNGFVLRFTVSPATGFTTSTVDSRAFRVWAPPPDINVQRNTTSIADGATDNVGTQPVGTSFNLVYTIQNTGTSQLNLGTITFINTTNCTPSISGAAPATVAAAGSGTLTVSVTVPATGQFGFEIVIPSDDPDEDPYNVVVVGNQPGGGGGGSGDDGDDDEGGCVVAGAGLPVLLPGLLLLALRRRRRG